MEVHQAGFQEDKDSSQLWHFVAILLALIGLALSLYSVYHFRLVAAYGQSGASCNINATVNCDLVAASSYARFLNIPLGVWGSAYFFTILLLLFMSLRNLGNRQDHLLAYSICVVVGLLSTLVLAFISFKILGLACLVCIGIYAVNLLQGGILWYGFKRKFVSFENLNIQNFYSGIGSALMGVAVVLIAYNIIGEQDLKPKTDKTLSEPNAPQAHVEPVTHDIPVSFSAFSGLGEDYRKGPDDAKVKMIVFSDLECPACKGVSHLLEEIYQSFPGKILFVFRNYPLDKTCNPIVQHRMHEHACALASMARCAGRFGKFWDFHNLTYAKQSELKKNSPELFAKEVGLSDEQIAGCRSDKSLSEKVGEDIRLGASLGIDETPTIYLNGRRYSKHMQELKDEVKRLTEL